MGMEKIKRAVEDFIGDENAKKEFPEAAHVSRQIVKGAGASVVGAGLVLSPPARAGENKPVTASERAQRSTGQLALDSLVSDINKPGPEISGVISNSELACLEKNIYNEARGEIDEGKLAVAFVTLARAQSKKFPNSICGVVYQNKQFSWTFDHKILSPRPIDRARALQIRVLLSQLVAGQRLEDATTLLGMMLGLPSEALYYKRFDWDETKMSKSTAAMFKRLRFVKRIGNHDFFTDH